MQRIIDSLHNQYSDMPDIRVRKIVVDKQQRKVFCTISYPNLPSVNKSRQNDIIAYVKKLVPESYNGIVTLADDNFSESSFRRTLTELIKTKFPLYAVISKGMAISIRERFIDVVFHVDVTMQTNIEVAEVISKLTEYLADYTCYKVSFDIVVDKEITADLAEQERLVYLAVNRELLKPQRCFSVTNVVKHIGKVVVGSPMYIADIRKATDSCVICGVVSGKTLKSSKKDPNMYTCKFTLTDASGGSINCIIFVRLDITDILTIKNTMGKTDSEAQTISQTRTYANERKMKKMMDIYDSMEVVVRGKIAFNNFSEQLEMTVYDLSKCKIDPIDRSTDYNKPVANSYIVVQPHVYQEFTQTSFVNEIIGKSLLTGKRYVVLHVNSTGFNVVKDKIYAICAVKITDGHITERLFSYINPEMDVNDDDLSKINVSAADLVLCPTISEIISDLYKFTYNCDLVGLNLNKILDLVNYFAAPVGYRFTNNITSQTGILDALFDNSTFSKKPNCSKLEDVARQCKIPCKNIVFCGDSAEIAARCMVVIANNVK